MASLLFLGIFVSYFLVIIALFSFIGKNLIKAAKSNKRWNGTQATSYGILTLCSFGFTWYYMFKFLRWSFENYEKTLAQPEARLTERISAWVSNTGLFQQAWEHVCFGPLNWWWSEQLCLFTVGVWTTLVAVKGRQHHIQHLWSYMVLAQLVAVSVGYNLFNLALVLHPEPVPEKKADNRVPPLVWASVFLALVTVALSRFTDHGTFLPNLLVMHGLLILPLLGSQPFNSSRYSISLATVYFVIYTTSLAMRIYTLRVAIAELQGQDLNPLGFLMAAFDVFYSHPAQSSIGWDIIWTTVSFFVWVTQNPLLGNATFERLFIIFGAPLISIGVVAPSNLLNREKEGRKVLIEAKEE